MTTTMSRFVFRHLAFTGVRVREACLEFDDGVNFIYGASNTGKSFIRAGLSFMLGGKPKDLPEITEREPYDTAWLGLALPTLGDVSLSRATKGGPFQLRDGLWTAGPRSSGGLGVSVSTMRPGGRIRFRTCCYRNWA